MVVCEDKTMEMFHGRRRTRVISTAIAAVILFCGGVVVAWPAMAAYACPACYGLVPVTGDLFVERAMPAAERITLQESIAAAQKQVASFYGSFDRRPTVFACETDACDYRLGGRGARATTFGTSFIRLSPRGLSRTILAHEFSHIEFHARIGDYQLLTGKVPAWFDEGLAVIVSNDARYLGPGSTRATHCPSDNESDLPSSPFQWDREAAKTHALYAQAACRVLRWLETNGGVMGLRVVMNQVADGTRGLP